VAHSFDETPTGASSMPLHQPVFEQLAMHLFDFVEGIYLSSRAGHADFQYSVVFVDRVPT
jgi:hypothetical protein